MNKKLITFSKYHGLGNDYIVIAPSSDIKELTTKQIQNICHRNTGVGSDGILFGPTHLNKEDQRFGLKIYNPDGSEAEKSGNGLRIFARYLYDQKLIQVNRPFKITTLCGDNDCEMLSPNLIKVQMGTPKFLPSIQYTHEKQNYTLYPVELGNPHCVIVCGGLNPQVTNTIGPIIENLDAFPRKTNVQFLKVIDQNNIEIEIWERGAGRTLASGSSSCGASAVAHHLGLCSQNIKVHMPGGQLDIEIKDNHSIQMIGPVEWVFDGTFLLL